MIKHDHVDLLVELQEDHLLGGGFIFFFMFTPNLGEMIPFDEHISFDNFTNIVSTDRTTRLATTIAAASAAECGCDSGASPHRNDLTMNSP